jgi:tetratricopeptide (TPR) repeat protein/tRNA A-37 threonylcarbamoyl transferase component Bud32
MLESARPNSSQLAETLATPAPAPGRATADHPSLTTANRSRYALTRIHAEGGLGRIYIAHDNDLGRDVALKELKPAQADRPDAAQRLLKEAQVTGQLEHPNIVPVYELACWPQNEQPFYTMRLVGGQTMRAIIAAYHERRREGKTDPLELRRLLGAFVSVCQALGYAHSRGVIHRDLKPENVVLGAFGEVIVLDWGLAKMLGHPDDLAGPRVALSAQAQTDETLAGQILGTPAYMAPEQAEGQLDQLDARTDIYGLGAILFEILTGQPPHAGPDLATLLTKISEGPTPRPRATAPGVPAALDAVCAKAMARQRDQRYPTAVALAEDVQRWLADEPVSAYREPLPARLGRWARRHKSSVTGVAALLLTAVVALTISTVLVGREKARTEAALAETRAAQEKAEANFQLALQAQARTEAALAETRTTQEKAEANFKLALQAVDDFHTKVSDSPDLKAHGLEKLRASLLKTARDFYERFIQERGKEPALQAELGRALRRLARITEEIGSMPDAIALQQQALGLFERLAGEHPDSITYQAELGTSHYHLASLYGTTGKFGQAEEAAKKALAIREQVARADPSVPDRQKELAQGHLALGVVYSDTSKWKPAEAAYRQALEVASPLAQTHPKAAEYQRLLAAIHGNLANLYFRSERFKQAVAAHRESIGILDRLASEYPTDPVILDTQATAHHNLCLVYNQIHKFDLAEKELTKSAAIRDQLVREHPAVTDYQDLLASNQLALGLLYSNLGNFKMDRAEQAEAAFQKSAAILEKLAPQHPTVPRYRQRLLRAHMSLGFLHIHVADHLSDAGRREEAEAAYFKALHLREQMTREDRTDPEVRDQLAWSHEQLGRWYAETNRPDESEAALCRAAYLWGVLCRKHPTIPDYQLHLAMADQSLGISLSHKAIARKDVILYERGTQAIRTAVEIREKLLREDPKNTSQQYLLGLSLGILAINYQNEGSLCLQTSRLAQAVTACQRSIDLWNRLAKLQPLTPQSRNGLAISYNLQGLVHHTAKQWDQAEVAYAEALRLRKELAATDPSAQNYQHNLGQTYNNLGVVYAATRRPEQAETHYRASAAVFEKLRTAYPTEISYQNELARGWNNLSLLYRATDRLGPAEAAARKVLAIYEQQVRANPKAANFAATLGWSQSNLGLRLMEADKPQESLDWFSQAIGTLEGVLKKVDHHAEARGNLRDAHCRRAQALTRLGRYPEALQEWDRAMGLADDMSRALVRLQRDGTLATKGDYVQATAEAKALAEQSPGSADILYDAACVYALASGAVHKDAKLAAAEREQLAEPYADRAIELLRQAAAKGYQDVAQLKRDKDLDALRARPGFQKLLADLEKPTPPAKADKPGHKPTGKS